MKKMCAVLTQEHDPSVFLPPYGVVRYGLLLLQLWDERLPQGSSLGGDYRHSLALTLEAAILGCAWTVRAGDTVPTKLGCDSEAVDAVGVV